MFYSITLAGESSSAVESIHGGVKVAVRFAQLTGHHVDVLQIGERGIRIQRAGIKNPLGDRSYLLDADI